VQFVAKTDVVEHPYWMEAHSIYKNTP